MKLVYKDRLELYFVEFHVAELYEFGCSLLLDLKSPFSDPFFVCRLSEDEKINVMRWALGAEHNGFASIDEVKRDFLCWYGINVGGEHE